MEGVMAGKENDDARDAPVREMSNIPWPLVVLGAIVAWAFFHNLFIGH